MTALHTSPATTRKRRMLQILTAGALATGALVAGPTGQAFADGPNFVQVRLSGTIVNSDDDGLNNRPTTTTRFTRTVTLLTSPAASRTKVVKIAGACAGGEVRSELQVTLTYNPTSNKVVVNGAVPLGNGLRLFEGTSCDTTDLDGTSGFAPTTFTQPNSSTTLQLVAQTGEAFSIDAAVADLKIERLV